MQLNVVPQVRFARECPIAQFAFVGSDSTVRQYVVLEFISPAEFFCAAGVVSERTTEPLDRVMDMLVSAQFVPAIERSLANPARERLLGRVNQSVYPQVAFGLERLRALGALVLAFRAVDRKVTPQVAFARKDLLAMRT